MLNRIVSDLWGPDFTEECWREAVELGGEDVGFQTVLAVAISKILKKKKTKVDKTETGPTWRAFSDAYQKRYGTPPVRNAMMNAQMGSFVRRIGVLEGPEVAVFYVFHNDPFYKRNAHSIGMMVKDAEKLRTEWATGKNVSTRRQTTAEANSEIAAELWKKNQEGKL